MNRNHTDYFKIATQCRIKYLQMVASSREALIPSAFSMLDIIVYLFENNLILNSENDIIISKGHAASVLYPLISKKHSIDLKYGEDGSPFGIYANVEIPGIVMPSGSLGHGLGVAAGIHIANPSQQPTFVFLGDGECFEGSIWEAFMLINNLRLCNIIPVIDYNNRTILGDLDNTYPNYNLESKLSGFGFDVHCIDGHNFKDIDSAVEKCLSNSTPSLILARTVKGKGVPFMEESHLWHNRMPSPEQLATTINQLSALCN